MKWDGPWVYWLIPVIQMLYHTHTEIDQWVLIEDILYNYGKFKEKSLQKY